MDKNISNGAFPSPYTITQDGTPARGVKKKIHPGWTILGRQLVMITSAFLRLWVKKAMRLYQYEYKILPHYTYTNARLPFWPGQIGQI